MQSFLRSRHDVKIQNATSTFYHAKVVQCGGPPIVAVKYNSLGIYIYYLSKKLKILENRQ